MHFRPKAFAGRPLGLIDLAAFAVAVESTLNLLNPSVDSKLLRPPQALFLSNQQLSN